MPFDTVSPGCNTPVPLAGSLRHYTLHVWDNEAQAKQDARNDADNCAAAQAWQSLRCTGECKNKRITNLSVTIADSGSRLLLLYSVLYWKKCYDGWVEFSWTATGECV